MRLLIAGSPKTGNVWIKCLLSEIYGLKILDNYPPTGEPDDLQKYIEQGLFVDDAIFHQHYHPSDLLFKLMDSVSGQIVTMIRNPYDAFVSQFYYIQNFREIIPPEHEQYKLIDKPIDHPVVLDWLTDVDGFGIQILLSNMWVESGKSVVVRYEDLYRDTASTLKTLTSGLATIEDEKVERAIEMCRVSVMRKRGSVMKRHVRTAIMGDWQNHLSQLHLDLFRKRYAQEIVKMGYQIV